MNVVVALLALVGACLASLVAFEVWPATGSSDPVIVADAPVASPTAAAAPAAAPAATPSALNSLADTLLTRPLFSQTRRPPNVAGPVASAPSSATPLPRMTAILIDGPRRSAIFAAPSSSGGKPTIVAEGGRIGPFTIQTIEPQQVIVMGPEGKRIVRTSFDPTLPPPPTYGLASPQFPGIALPGGVPGAIPGGPPLMNTPPGPSAGYGLPQSAGAAR